MNKNFAHALLFSRKIITWKADWRKVTLTFQIKKSWVHRDGAFNNNWVYIQLSELTLGIDDFGFEGAINYLKNIFNLKVLMIV